MNPSHKRNPNPVALHHRKPYVTGHAESKEFNVLRLAPHYLYAPEYVACAGNNAVAHFFVEADAKEYVLWKNRPCPTKPPTPIA